MPNQADGDRNLEIAVETGEIIFREGDDTNRDLYILLDGTVEIRKGSVLLAEVSGQKVFLGEMSTLRKEPRSATVIAKTPCRLYRIPEDHVRKFLLSHPSLAVSLAEVLAERLSQMNRRFEEAMRKAGSPPAAEAFQSGMFTAISGSLFTPRAEDESVLEEKRSSPPPVEPSPIPDESSLEEPLRASSASETPAESEVVASFPRVEAIAREEGGSATPYFPSSAAPSELRERLEAEIGAVEAPPFNEALVQAVLARIGIWIDLQNLAILRRKLEAEPGCDEAVQNELASQWRILESLPTRQGIEEDLAKTRAILREREEGAKVTGLLRAAYKLRLQLFELLEKRAAMTESLLERCAHYASAEPLYRIGAKLGLGTERLLGWAIYGMALEEASRFHERKLREGREKAEATAQQKTGFLGLLSAEPGENPQQTLLQMHEDVLAAVKKEEASIEEERVECFWRVYGKVAEALLRGVLPTEEPYLRAFLRWGLLGVSPRFLPVEEAKRIILECAEPLRELFFTLTTTPVLYADEYLLFVAQGRIAPSFSEELELHQRETPLWHADKAWRRLLYNQRQKGYLEESLEALRKRTEFLRKKQAEHEKAAFEATDGRQAESFREAAQECRVESARLERIAEKVRSEMLPRIQDDQKATQERFEKLGITFDSTTLLSREVAAVRRVCRLVSHLHEPFLPFSLRDFLARSNPQLYDRPRILADLADAERRDWLLFRTELIPIQNKRHRVYLRLAPIILIAPAPGEMGYVWTPRAGTEYGRLALPAYGFRWDAREAMLWEVLADYRFDTSKAEAGVDTMNSDTLAATYAAMRWGYRRRAKEYRQKAGVYLEENDRTNWRRHYAMYMKSAFENGKQLFYKCPELYEAIIGKFIELPEGGIKMRQA